MIISTRYNSANNNISCSTDGLNLNVLISIFMLNYNFTKKWHLWLFFGAASLGSEIFVRSLVKKIVYSVNTINQHFIQSFFLEFREARSSIILKSRSFSKEIVSKLLHLSWSIRFCKWISTSFISEKGRLPVVKLMHVYLYFYF